MTVDPETARAVVPPLGFGMHTSVYDNAFQDEDLPDLLNAAGIHALRYPGGGYSDNYHWWNHTMTPWQTNGDDGYLAEGTDFGSFVALLKSFDGSAVITVNYGSNLAGDGPGEPEEAAAWVAYANGDPENSLSLGVDASGKNWNTVGYWASLRGAAPLAEDDGLNFLRISEPEPLGIEYWEIGNELFGNGYYGTNYEQDLHLAYQPGDDHDYREGREELSPTTYGNGVLTFLQAMKAVDPTIKVGAVLNTPPKDYSWGPNWNADVLAACGQPPGMVCAHGQPGVGDQIDFVIVHWYPATTDGGLVRAPQREVADMTAELARSFATYGSENPADIGIFVTEMGPAPGYEGNASRNHAVGTFAADGYATLLEHGIDNIDWLELHNGTFLSERSDALGPAYKGIQLTHRLASPGDTLVTATSSDANVHAHAARRADGNTTLMLTNTSDSLTAFVDVTITGAATWSSGVKYDYFPAEDGITSGDVVGPTELTELGDTLAFEIPPFGVTHVALTP